MDSSFKFLTSAQFATLNAILNRRNPNLLKRIQRSTEVSLADADEIVSTLSEEFMNNLDEDWEPIEYGRIVNGVLARVNAARIDESTE